MPRLALALLVLAVGCASTQPPSGPARAPLPAGWRIDASTRELVHVGSLYHFAATHRGCTRVDPHAYDASGANVSVGYQCTDRVLWLTFYVYPNSFGGAPDPTEHFRMVVSEVLVSHDGAELERAVQMNLPLGSRIMTGYNAFLHWYQRDDEIGSFVVLIPDGDRFVKVRTSFLLDGTSRPVEDAWGFTLDLLRTAAPAA
jgi:hypothetical protein